MNRLIGPNHNIQDALDILQFNDGIPVVKFRGNVFVIDYEGRTRGCLYYTKFVPKSNTYVAEHSVSMPFSKQYTVGELLDRGEGMQSKIPPTVDSLPAEAYGILDYTVEPTIKKYFE